MLRSLLFVPGDSERKLAKAAAANADALILDLEDAVSADRKACTCGRRCLLRCRSREDAPAIWVRINALGTDGSREDLEAVVAGSLTASCSQGQICGRSTNAGSIPRRTGDSIGHQPGRIVILPTVTETALPCLSSYLHGGSAAVAGAHLGYGRSRRELGVSRRRDMRGNWLPVFNRAGDGASGGGGGRLPAIDTIYAEYTDLKG